MASRSAHAQLIDPRDLLELLHQQALPTPFKFALYSEENHATGLWDAIRSTCRRNNNHPPCNEECFKSWQDVVGQALLSRSPVVRCCPQGYLGFAVPLPNHEGMPDCLIGGGIKEDDQQQSSSEGTFQTPPNPLIIPDNQKIVSRATRETTASLAEEISQTLPRLLDQKLHSMSLARTTQRLEAVSEISRDLAKCTNIEQALTIISEALVILFDLPKVLILLKSASKAMTLHTTLGLSKETCQIDGERLLEHMAETQAGPEALDGEDLATFFPGLDAQSAYLVPMAESACEIGAVVLLDVTLHSRDRALIELLVCRLAARLERLRIEEGHERERQYSTRMVSMISSLSLINNQEQLLDQILEMSGELIGASSGSLMLLDEIEGTLNIATAKGMNASLARSMSVHFGEGIAGRVAKTGFPMLVNDIERDSRTASRNRPRFKTKSFISLPLRVKDRLVGVLNLADKKDGTSFSETDLNLVQTFTGHAVLMIDRAATLEQADQFEKLSITDSLTGLYNRRFLETRLQEEISRCQRQNQSFCVILADLDNFKVYNDICGHLAGDKALRKAAVLMTRTAREMDVVTRYGGEEFCLILPGTSKRESVFVGERIRRTIEAETFPGETHLPLGRLTISLGIASFAEDGQSATELLHAADLALYQAKDLGRNHLVLYDPSLETQSPLRAHHRGDQS